MFCLSQHALIRGEQGAVTRSQLVPHGICISWAVHGREGMLREGRELGWDASHDGNSWALNTLWPAGAAPVAGR